LSPAEQKKKLDEEIEAIKAESQETAVSKTLSVEMEGGGLFKIPGQWRIL